MAAHDGHRVPRQLRAVTAAAAVTAAPSVHSDMANAPPLVCSGTCCLRMRMRSSHALQLVTRFELQLHQLHQQHEGVVPAALAPSASTAVCTAAASTAV